MRLWHRGQAICWSFSGKVVMKPNIKLEEIQISLEAHFGKLCKQKNPKAVIKNLLPAGISLLQITQLQNVLLSFNTITKCPLWPPWTQRQNVTARYYFSQNLIHHRAKSHFVCASSTNHTLWCQTNKCYFSKGQENVIRHQKQPAQFFLLQNIKSVQLKMNLFSYRLPGYDILGFNLIIHKCNVI